MILPCQQSVCKQLDEFVMEMLMKTTGPACGAGRCQQLQDDMHPAVAQTQQETQNLVTFKTCKLLNPAPTNLWWLRASIGGEPPGSKAATMEPWLVLRALQPISLKVAGKVFCPIAMLISQQPGQFWLGAAQQMRMSNDGLPQYNEYAGRDSSTAHEDPR